MIRRLHRRIRIHLLKHRLDSVLKKREQYVESSAFDLNISPFDYRMALVDMADRIEDLKGKLTALGVNVNGKEL